jgi:RNA polymerase-binding protein DksA
MSKEELEFYRSILLDKRKYTLNNIEQLREMSQVEDSDTELNEKYSDHLADQGSDSMRKEESFMLISRELQYLYRIDNALKSIDIGKYGICKICGKEISRERLEAVPTTDTCINCKSKQVKRSSLI